jgi:hypothetical protein
MEKIEINTGYGDGSSSGSSRRDGNGSGSGIGDGCGSSGGDGYAMETGLWDNTDAVVVPVTAVYGATEMDAVLEMVSVPVQEQETVGATVPAILKEQETIPSVPVTVPVTEQATLTEQEAANGTRG